VIRFSPTENEVRDIRNILGLGSLIYKFEAVTPDKELCKKLKAVTKVRNELAHRAASNFLKFPVSYSGAEQCLAKAQEFGEAAAVANSLFYELSEVFENIMGAHGEIV